MSETQVVDQGKVIAIRLSDPMTPGELVSRDGTQYQVSADGYSLVPVGDTAVARVGISPLGMVVILVVGYVAFRMLTRRRRG